MRRCIIMRGLPGSGKSTYAKGYFGPNSFYFSTDSFFEENGVYNFNPTKLGENHNKCLLAFSDVAYNYRHSETTNLIVDNTNIRVFEIAPYYRLAEAFGYQVDILWCVAPINLCVIRNIHGVPEQKIREMANSFEALPPWWKQTIICTDDVY